MHGRQTYHSLLLMLDSEAKSSLLHGIISDTCFRCLHYELHVLKNRLIHVPQSHRRDLW